MSDNKRDAGGKKESGKQSWQDRKLKKVVRDDIDVISRKTLDQSDFITMLNTHDNVLYQFRMKMGRNSNITFEKAQEFIERSQKIREDINLLNAEMCELMDWDYTPPRGFTNPMAKSADGEKKGSKKTPKDLSAAKAIEGSVIESQ
ncbi:hypothetical protein OR1_00542 [Geobacter sp. OR-1]|uniref:hypothetical protein n=1 Tax=Geobacter sp. OR-1 TaxID=1266765 RepID=UPI000541DD2E|nr:hypothetical protein [Geobacter sp. OR-1]GAM08271.1 hypothetical protein OR1_00542 [Geobacter sp. OR-1]